MSQKLILFSTVGAFLLLASCAHHRNVRPGAEGVHKVIIQTDDVEAASENALDQANHFCSEKKGGKSAVIVDEGKKYTGDMDEENYKKVKTASKVAKTVGGMAHVFGGKNESNAGGLAWLGGSAGDAAAGKGYTIEMKFKCE